MFVVALVVVVIVVSFVVVIVLVVFVVVVANSTPASLATVLALNKGMPCDDDRVTNDAAPRSKQQSTSGRE